MNEGQVITPDALEKTDAELSGAESSKDRSVDADSPSPETDRVAPAEIKNDDDGVPDLIEEHQELNAEQKKEIAASWYGVVVAAKSFIIENYKAIKESGGQFAIFKKEKSLKSMTTVLDAIYNSLHNASSLEEAKAQFEVSKRLFSHLNNIIDKRVDKLRAEGDDGSEALTRQVNSYENLKESFGEFKGVLGVVDSKAEDEGAGSQDGEEGFSDWFPGFTEDNLREELSNQEIGLSPELWSQIMAMLPEELKNSPLDEASLTAALRIFQFLHKINSSRREENQSATPGTESSQAPAVDEVRTNAQSAETTASAPESSTTMGSGDQPTAQAEGTLGSGSQSSTQAESAQAAAAQPGSADQSPANQAYDVDLSELGEMTEEEAKLRRISQAVLAGMKGFAADGWQTTNLNTFLEALFLAQLPGKANWMSESQYVNPEQEKTISNEDFLKNINNPTNCAEALLHCIDHQKPPITEQGWKISKSDLEELRKAKDTPNPKLLKRLHASLVLDWHVKPEVWQAYSAGMGDYFYQNQGKLLSIESAMKIQEMAQKDNWDSLPAWQEQPASAGEG